jgi:hypothetical protein
LEHKEQFRNVQIKKMKNKKKEITIINEVIGNKKYIVIISIALESNLIQEIISSIKLADSTTIFPINNYYI